MFLRHDEPVYADLSLCVRDPVDWKVGTLRRFEFPLDITAVAFDPVSRLLAIGTGGGVIHLHGGPGVETQLLLPKSISVRFVQFGLQTERLVCLDSEHHLHIWDLSPIGCPKLMTTVRWDPTTFILLSPSHNHVFLAMRNGDLRTYDLACMRKSPYMVPNLWRLHEEQIVKSGMPVLPSDNSGSQPVELLPHPRNLNLLFIAYQNGVTLLDLKERSSIRTFELVLPPGAPGGAGYNSRDILLPRRSSVTSIAIHPAGHLFAVGHADGTIAFWATEDANRPLFVRSLDDLDVDKVDVKVLEAHLSKTDVHDFSPREPIFKMTWSGFPNSSDPRGGETALTILGGFKPDNGFGLTVLWFSPFNPEDPPSGSSSITQDGIHSSIATAFRQTLEEPRCFIYTTNTPVQDFYLIPRESPHFNYAYDPHTILILVDAGQDARKIESREFPPPSFTSSQAPSTPTRATQTEGDTLQALDFALESLSMTTHPQLVGLPFKFNGGNFIPDNYRIQSISREMYRELINSCDSSGKCPKIRLTGGSAYMDSSHEVKMSKFHPHRILITSNRNLTVSFYDISDQLLQGTKNSPLEHDFPEALGAFEIDLQPAMDILDSERSLDEAYDQTRTILSTHFAAEGLECAIALSTGEVLVYRPKPPRTVQVVHDTQDEELRLLTHIGVEPWRKLVPYFALCRPERGSILAVAFSEIGFLATSFADGSLFVVDMRGPTVLHRPTALARKPSRSSKSSRSSRSSKHSRSSLEVDGIISLTWTISGIAKGMRFYFVTNRRLNPQPDSKACIRLIAFRTSGNMEVYSVIRASSGFSFEGPVTLSKLVPYPLRDGTFVINSKTGALCKADRGRFAAMLRSDDRISEPVILITASTKGARSFANITGERVGKIDWSSRYGDVISVQIVERLGSRVLVAYTSKGEFHAYSLPYLEHIYTSLATSASFKSISIDEHGDFINFDTHPSFGLVQSATYGTLFDFRRVNDLPLIDFASNKGTVPPQPQPVPIGPSSLLGSWFKYNQTMPGGQIDGLLAGLDRPAPVKGAREVLSKKVEELERMAPSSTTNTSPATSITASATAVQSNVYNRLMTALNERGQMLGELDQNFKALEQGSKDMVTQAKRLAAQNTAKSWFGF